MSKSKVMFCLECGTNRVHKLVSKDNDFEDIPVFRVFAALCTFGVSEAFSTNKYYQCEKCGHIKRVI